MCEKKIKSGKSYKSGRRPYQHSMEEMPILSDPWRMNVQIFAKVSVYMYVTIVRLPMYRKTTTFSKQPSVIFSR